MHLQKGRISQRLLHAAIVVCLSLLLLTSIGITAAKYASEVSGNAGTSVAKFSPSLVSDNIIDISEIRKPGDSTDKIFRVQNFSGDNVSEVTMKYKIVLKTTGNLPLHFTVLDSSESVIADWSCDGISENQNYEYECPILFSPGISQAHDYKLRVEWSNTQNDAKFSGMTDAVYLSVIWEQID